ncbi:hypothetical protein HHX47_DHR1000670 [Lentinula edodes]|nr:hypothetical protein HHX47_DHR1000670 [Lentinula edodes]
MMPYPYLIPRSGSIAEHIQLPRSLPTSRNPSFDSANAPSLSRRESYSVAVQDVPITPPLSPGQTEPVDIDMEDDADIEVLDMNADEGRASSNTTEIAVGDNSALSPVPTSAMAPRKSREAIDISRVRENQALSHPMGGPEGHRPLKLLEDEEVHLQKGGVKLTDFEVPEPLAAFF